MLTFLPLEQIDAMDAWEGSKLNEAKEILAYELTKLVHGTEEAEKAKEASHALFAGGGDDSNMPSTRIMPEQLTDNAISILELMDVCHLAASRSEARHTSGVFADEQKVESIDVKFTADQLKTGIRLRKGKKVYHKAYME